MYYTSAPVSDEETKLMRAIDEIHLEEPYLGSRRIASLLKMRGIAAGRSRVRTLMRKMGIEAVYKKPRLSKPHPEHKIYPYLLRGLDITEANSVWAADITYIPMARGFCYLVAIMDLSKQESLVLEAIEHIGCVLLHRGSRRSLNEIRNTRHIQHRPGEPVHVFRVYEYSH